MGRLPGQGQTSPSEDGRGRSSLFESGQRKMSPPESGRAQTSPLGVALLVGITLATATAIVVFGGAALEGTQEDSRMAQAEQAMTQFDSKAAQVALGEAGAQRVQLGGAGGTYRVDPEAGNLTLYHYNRTEEEGNYEELYSTSLGAVVFESGTTEIAYQGGGVWRLDDDAATMVSPPEFHYRGATLTFPVVTVVGDASTSGSQAVRILGGETSTVFPNESRNYEDGEPYRNPIENGSMIVEIESAYCEGWQSYLASRSEGNVSECDDGVVNATLETFGDRGELDITGGTISPRGVGELQESTITFSQTDAGQASDFNNFEWSMYGEDDDDRQFELYAESIEGQGDMEEGDPIRIVMYYSPDGGDTYETWVNDENFTIEVDDEPYVTVDMLGDVEMERKETDEFDGTGGDIPRFEGEEFNETPFFEDEDTAPIENITRDYFDQLDETDLHTQEANNANMGDASSWAFDYEGGGQVITYLHVTENEIEAEIT